MKKSIIILAIVALATVVNLNAQNLSSVSLSFDYQDAETCLNSFAKQQRLSSGQENRMRQVLNYEKNDINGIILSYSLDNTIQPITGSGNANVNISGNDLLVNELSMQLSRLSEQYESSYRAILTPEQYSQWSIRHNEIYDTLRKGM